jgi:hydrophobic/amphiphilic exporter-1 (mainly G- bacteria), HAE1 family
MSIPETFIRRPVATTLVMVGILIFGVIGYRALPVSDLPSVDYPTLQVQVNLPGANPDTMGAAVALPLEKQFSTISGLDSMVSQNLLGQTRITLQFNLKRSLDGAAQDVQNAIAQAARQLPSYLPSPPSLQKVNPADQPVLFVALTSATMSLTAVDEYAENLLAQSISTVPGVGKVDVYGAAKFAVHVQLDPHELATRHIGIDEVSTALNDGNVNMPAGVVWGTQKTSTLQATGQLFRAADYQRLIVAYRNGSPVRLADLGNVIDGIENPYNSSAYYDAEIPKGMRIIQLAISKQPGSNVVDVVDGVKRVLPTLEAQLPPAISMKVLNDRSLTIRNSVEDVKFTLELALFLVVLVIFLFLRNLSATLIPSLALPLSLVGTFAVMYLCGFSMDNLSLMAMTLSVGFVVDDAIVMLENIVRHIEMGKTVFQAALDGANEIGFTILSMTLSLAAVFLPVLFMGGVLGRLLNEFAVTIISAILISGFVSLSLTPMLCSRFIKSHRNERHGYLFNYIEKMYNGLTNIYDRCLKVTLRHQPATLMISLLLLVGTVYLYMIVPKGFLPSEDIEQFNITAEAVEGISFEGMVDHTDQAGQIVAQDPAVAYVQTSIGCNCRSLNQSQINVRLKPRSQRPQVEQVMQELRPKLAAIPGLTIFMRNDPPIRIGGLQSKALYQFTLQTPNTQELYRSALDFEQKMRALPQLVDVSSDVQIRNPQVNVIIDRDAASAVGVSAAQIEDALYSAYGLRQISTILAPNNQYRVLLELRPEYQKDANAISMLYVRSKATGLPVPLGSIAKLSNSLGPASVNHLGQVPASTISFNLRPGYSIGDAVTQIDELARTALPPTITTTFQGNAQAFQSSFAGLGLLVLMSILVIYLILGILYESFIHPITILSGLPSAGFGALLSLYLFHTAAVKGWVSPLLDMNLDLYGFVGVIMLVGIVKKNAIMMIDFALEAQRSEGKAPTDAIYEGCLARFRPIMMTTMAALMGTLPIALGLGAGAESRRALGVSVVGGLFFSQIVTLFLTPVVYIYLERARLWIGTLFGRRHTTELDSGHPSSGPISSVSGD